MVIKVVATNRKNVKKKKITEKVKFKKTGKRRKREREREKEESSKKK